MKIEKDHEKELPELSLGKAISAASPYKPGCFGRILARLFVRDERFWKDGEVHSDGKIELFYKPVGILLLVASLMLALAGGVSRGVPKPVHAEQPAE